MDKLEEERLLRNRELRGKAIERTAIKPQELEGQALVTSSDCLRLVNASGLNNKGAHRVVQLLLIALCQEFIEVDGEILMQREISIAEEVGHFPRVPKPVTKH